MVPVPKRLPPILLLLAFCCPCLAMVPGVPDGPRPGPLPWMSLSWVNDAFGGDIGENRDDFRTNAISVSWRMTERWLLCLDHSTLTNKELAGGLRTDEISCGLGLMVSEAMGAAHSHHILLGAGLRSWGNFGGELSQNGWHTLIGLKEVDLPYEDEGLGPYVFLSGHYMYAPLAQRETDFMPYVGAGRLGWTFDTALLFGAHGQMQADAALRAVVLGSDGGLWLGFLQSLRRADDSTQTADSVADREEGPWLTYGGSAGGFFFEGGYQLDSGASIGRLGWMWDRQDLPGSDNGAALHGEIGPQFTELGLSGMDVLFRWQPNFLPRGSRTSLYLDYRYGRVPGHSFHDAVLKHQQFTIGFDQALLQAHDHWQAQPYIIGGLGYRREETQHTGDHPNIGIDAAEAPALQVGCGLRMAWNDLPRQSGQVRYGLNLGLDGDLPLRTAIIGTGEERTRVLEPVWNLGIRLHAHVLW